MEPRRRVGVVADAAADDADEPDAPAAAAGPPPAAPAAPPPLPTASPACSGGRWTWGGVTELRAAGVECRAVGMCLREPKPTGVKGLAVEPPSECGGEAKSGRAMKASAGGRWARSSGFKGASVACLLSHTHTRKESDVGASCVNWLDGSCVPSNVALRSKHSKGVATCKHSARQEKRVGGRGRGGVT